MAKIDEPAEPDDGEAAAFARARRIVPELPVGWGVGHLGGGAVLGERPQPAPAEPLGKVRVELLAKRAVHSLQHFDRKLATGLAVARRVRRGDRQTLVGGPLLDIGNRVATRGIIAGDLKEDSPKHQLVGIGAATLGLAVLFQQIGRNLVAQLLLDVDAALEKGVTLPGENRLHGAL